MAGIYKPCQSAWTGIRELEGIRGPSALSKIDPFVLSKTDPYQEHDLPVGKTVSSTPKACFILPTGKISNFRA